MPRYQCPECQAVLKRELPAPPGKRLKCPKCAAVFVPSALTEGAKKTDDDVIGLAAAPPAFQPAMGGKDKVVEDDDGGIIGLAPETDSPNLQNAAAKKKQEKVEEEEGEGAYGVLTEKKDDTPAVNFGSLRDKFAKSKIGPAMYLTVTSSNWLLRLGLFSSCGAILKAFYDVFPLIFCEVAPLRPFIRPQITLLTFDVIVFGLGAVMCVGASRMHDLRSFPMAIVGAVMAIVIYMPICIVAASILLLMFGWTGLMMSVAIGLISLVGVWCLVVIMKPLVREGFKERAEMAS